MKKLHEAFVQLAGRVHTIHTTLQNYKDDYLTYRRRVLGDSSDIFSKGQSAAKSSAIAQLNKIGSGPSPFGGNLAPNFIYGNESGMNGNVFQRCFGSPLADVEQPEWGRPAELGIQQREFQLIIVQHCPGWG